MAVRMANGLILTIAFASAMILSRADGSAVDFEDCGSGEDDFEGPGESSGRQGVEETGGEVARRKVEVIHQGGVL